MSTSKFLFRCSTLTSSYKTKNKRVLIYKNDSTTYTKVYETILAVGLHLPQLVLRSQSLVERSSIQHSYSSHMSQPLRLAPILLSRSRPQTPPRSDLAPPTSTLWAGNPIRMRKCNSLISVVVKTWEWLGIGTRLDQVWSIL